MGSKKAIEMIKAHETMIRRSKKKVRLESLVFSVATIIACVDYFNSPSSELRQFS